MIKITTKKIFLLFKRIKLHYLFRRMYMLDQRRYLKYSRTLGNNTPDKLAGSITVQYHVLEKGLTMPEIKKGFGRDRVISLCRECMKYIEKYGQENEQLNHAVGVIFEYEDFHRLNAYSLDREVEDSINRLRGILHNNVEKTSQTETTRTGYFKYIDNPFPEFSGSRSSVRNFTGEEVPVQKIMKALDMARNAPSACNRQSWRTYVYTGKEIIARLLEAQGGNRGFGHLVNKLIIIAGELGVFCYTNERNQVYTDGGIYAMNLLYAIHSNEIASCILNCSFDHRREEEIKNLAGIKESEVLIAMIACGIPPVEFKIAVSPRYGIDKTNKIIN